MATYSPTLRAVACAGESTTTQVDATVLIARVAGGDKEAFAELYDLIIGPIFGVVSRVLRDPAQSEEVTQEVLLEIWVKATRFAEQRGTVLAWAVTIAHRRAVDRVRHERPAPTANTWSGGSNRGLPRPTSSTPRSPTWTASASAGHSVSSPNSSASRSSSPTSRATPTARSPRSSTSRSAPSRPGCATGSSGCANAWRRNHDRSWPFAH